MLTTEQWNDYAASIEEVNKIAEQCVLEFVAAVDFDAMDTAILQDLFTEYCSQVASQYGEAAATLAAQIYTEVLASVGVDDARIANIDFTGYDSIESAIADAFDELVNENGAIEEKAKDSFIKKLVGAVKDAISDLKNDVMEKCAEMNAGKVPSNMRHWYAYIPAPDACPFCVMVASNGWSETKKTMASSFKKLHTNCRCNVIVDIGTYKEVNSKHGYDFTPYKKLYEECKVEGGKGDEEHTSAHRPYKTLWQMEKRIKAGALQGIY